MHSDNHTTLAQNRSVTSLAMETPSPGGWQWAQGPPRGTALSPCAQQRPRSPESIEYPLWEGGCTGHRKKSLPWCTLGAVENVHVLHNSFWLFLASYPPTQVPPLRHEWLRSSLKTFLSLSPLLNYTPSNSEGITKEEINLPLCFAGISAHFWVKTPTWQRSQNE